MTAKKIIPKVLIIAFVVGFGVLCALTGNIMSPVSVWHFSQRKFIPHFSSVF